MKSKLVALSAATLLAFNAGNALAQDPSDDSAAMLALLPLAGCNLYFGSDDEPPPCDPYPYPGAPQEFRDPQTGACQYIGGGGGGCFYDEALPAVDIAMPDWGSSPTKGCCQTMRFLSRVYCYVRLFCVSKIRPAPKKI